ncbi:MAG: hypothetical protein IJU76_04260 [Desulfovibrionaceae bacterium]|nr:hypothetical protein [Desulfovibrionaceae bacterium]
MTELAAELLLEITVGVETTEITMRIISGDEESRPVRLVRFENDDVASIDFRKIFDGQDVGPEETEDIRSRVCGCVHLATDSSTISRAQE